MANPRCPGCGYTGDEPDWCSEHLRQRVKEARSGRDCYCSEVSDKPHQHEVES